ERGARAVEQRLPTDRARPAIEAFAIDPCGLVVVELIGDAVLVEPGTRLLHGVAVLDAIDGDRLGGCLCHVSRRPFLSNALEQEPRLVAWCRRYSGDRQDRA